MRRYRNPPPWVQEPDPNEQAHAVMNALVERLDPPSYEEARREVTGLLVEAAESLDIPVVRTD